jgi:integrase/recombinase XerD
MLTVIIDGYRGSGRPHHPEPFSGAVPGFFGYLTEERGLRPATIKSYRHYLNRFEAFLVRAGVTELDELSPVLLSAFTAERAGLGLAKTGVREGCGVLRVFLRYAHREGAIGRDLHQAVEWPQAYRLSTLPRSGSWDDVGKVLAAVDQRTPCGKRDYAILMLLATYGLRGREIVAMTLDDIDWKRGRLSVPERKGGHSTAFPLSGMAGDALAGYLLRVEYHRAPGGLRGRPGPAADDGSGPLVGQQVPRPACLVVAVLARDENVAGNGGPQLSGGLAGGRSPR